MSGKMVLGISVCCLGILVFLSRAGCIGNSLVHPISITDRHMEIVKGVFDLEELPASVVVERAKGITEATGVIIIYTIKLDPRDLKELTRNVEVQEREYDYGELIGEISNDRAITWVYEGYNELSKAYLIGTRPDRRRGAYWLVEDEDRLTMYLLYP